MLTISLESIYYKINTEYEYKILIKHNYSIIIDHNYKYCIISYYQLYILLGNKANIQYKYICNLCGKIYICSYYNIQNKYKKYQGLYCKPCIFIKKYGVRNPSQLDSIKKKKEQTTILHYGVKNPSQAEEIKKKKEQTSLLHYGVKYTLQAEEIKNYRKQTNLKKYGAECTLQVEEIKEKIKQTNLQKYGVENPSQSLEIQRKKEQTSLLHYGVKYTLQAEEIKEKIKQTNLQKYGVENPSQAQNIKDKKKQTYYNNLFNNNGNNNNQHVITSKQQLFFYQLFNSEFTILNYKFGNLFIDICFPQLKIGIEYNGGGHNLSVLHKDISQINFIKKEIRRAYFLHKYNWNMIYIISPHDKINIYTSEEYIQIFNYITVLFNIYNETWCEIYIENNYILTKHYKINIDYIINTNFNFDILQFYRIYSLKEVYILLHVNKRKLSQLIIQNNIKINKSYLNYRYIYFDDVNILLNKSLIYLSLRETIQYLNISYSKLYYLQKQNIIIPIIIDNKNMYNKQQLDQYLVMQQYYTPTKAAKYLNISLNQLYILNKKNKIKSININNKNMYDKKQLDQYIEYINIQYMLTYTEAAKYLHISLKKLYKLRKQNIIQTININGKNMYDKRQLKKYLKNKNK